MGGCYHMIHLVFAEASLELVPTNLLSHPSVKKYAERFNKGTSILLDDSYHHSAMRNLKHWEKRGRPDIVHLSLLEALGSPLCKEGKLKLYVHTWDDNLLIIDPSTRLPRNYNRFKGLMEQLLAETGKKSELIAVKKGITIKALMDVLGCGNAVIGFSRKGEKRKLKDIFSDSDLQGDVAVVIGGFPRGGFSDAVAAVIVHKISLHELRLDAWVVTSRVLTQLEMMYNLL